MANATLRVIVRAAHTGAVPGESVPAACSIPAHP